jgi:virginiamycin A acetyltransferase
MSFAKASIRRLAETVGVALTVPLVLLYRGHLMRYTTGSNALSLVPGSFGIFLRRGWYRQTLARCGKNLVVDFGAGIRTPRSRIGDDCYIGLWSWLGWVDMGSDFMSGSHVVILSGRGQHGFERTDRPMRVQHGELRCVTIGDDVWVGASVTIAEDVAPHTIVASGAVVTKRFEPYSILGGVPAKPVGSRLDSQAPVG